MVTVALNNHNIEADKLYEAAYILNTKTLRLLNHARECKYHEDIEVNQNYPEIVKATSQIEKLCFYIDETRSLIKKYDRIPIARVDDRPARTPKKRKDTIRQSFSLENFVVSD